MPRRPKSICRQPGCGAVIDSPGWCKIHAKVKQQQDAKERGTAQERGYTSRWSKARTTFLRKNPLCENCRIGGRVVPASVVDHIIPHKLKEAIDSGDEQRITQARQIFWNSDNWASLCKPCHDSVAQSCERNGTRKPWAK
jgi:5-methylcytosine-specific restriction protein A